MDVGIIGCGEIAQKTHIPLLRNISDVKIAWLSDVNADLGGRLSRSIGSSFVAAETPLKARRSVDLVVLAIPWGARAPILQQLAEMDDEQRPGLFLEKPVARKVVEHLAILASFEDWKIAAGLTRRGLPQVGCARAVVSEGLFGRLEGTNVRYGGLGRILTRGGYMGSLDLAGGGVLIEMGVHYIDTCLYVLGAKAARYKAGRMKTFEGFDLHTDMTFDLDLASGESIPMDLRITSLEAIESGIELVFERATVRFDISGRSSLDVVPRCSGQAFNLAAGPEFGPQMPHALAREFWSAFLKGFRERQANYTSAADVLTTTSVIEQAYEHG